MTDVALELGRFLAVLTPVLQICLIDLLLAGDNAVVIALACRGLPPRLWRQAVWLGTAAALALRIALTAAAALILNVPFLKLVGAALLLAIAVRLVAEESPHHAELDAAGRQYDLWKAITTIIVADTVMSLDNVLAVAAAARGSFWLLAFGLALSVPILIFGSMAVARMLERFPILILAGGALLGWVAGETAVSDPAIVPWIDREAAGLAQLAAPIGAAYVLIHERLARRWRTRRSAAGG
jgi:YjbE family integral membrane protein